MPITYVHVNFFDTEITDGVSASATTLRVTPSMAQLLPLTEEADDTLVQLTLWDGVQAPEIVSVTDNPQTGELTVIRGAESTTPRAWQAGTQIMCALTAQVINAALAAYFDIEEVLAATFLPLTGGTLTGMLVLPATVPTLGNHATNKTYVDNVLGNKLPLAGGTMAGSINMNSNRILALPEPVSSSEPSTKGYADNVTLTQSKINADRGVGLGTGGTPTAYTATSNTVYAALTDGITVTIKPHAVNGASPTLSLDSLTATPIQAIPGTNLPAGFLRLGVPYPVMYSTTYSAWLIVGAAITSTAWNAGDRKWSDIEADHDMWLLCDGRLVSRTTHAPLFAQIGTRYSPGDGSTTFGLPNMTGKTLIGRDNLDGAADNLIQVTTDLTTTATNTSATVASAAGLCIGMYVINVNVPANTTITNIVGLTITLSNAASTTGTATARFSPINDANLTGRSGGAVTHTLTDSEISAHTHIFTGDALAPHTHTESSASNAVPAGSTGSAAIAGPGTTGATSAGTPTGTNSSVGNDLPHNNMQPSMTSNPFIYSPH